VERVPTFETRRYRNSARRPRLHRPRALRLQSAFHLILFPGTPSPPNITIQLTTHRRSFGLVLLRLHGLGGTTWLAFYAASL